MTNKTSSLNADWVSPPGSSLADFIEETGDSLQLLAMKMQCDLRFLKRLLSGDEPIDSGLAARLAALTGVSIKFWLNRESQYRANLAKLEEKKSKNRQWLSELPTAEMVRYGWIKKASSSSQKLLHCLQFFGVSSVDEWQRRYEGMIGETAFRTSENFGQKMESVAAWLRQGEIQAEKYPCEQWDKDRLVGSIPRMRQLSVVQSPSVFIPELRACLASCGVSLAIVPTPRHCPASGAAYWLSESKALVILSFRYRTDDHFWFTFFHELGHLLLHGDHSLILESDDTNTSRIEEEANAFSECILIPEPYKHEFSRLEAKNLRGILKLARSIGISRGIVVGQMQHKRMIGHGQLNKLKTRYVWDCPG